MYFFNEGRVRYLIEICGMTQDDVVLQLDHDEGGIRPRGLSIRSLQRFCAEKNISKRSGVSSAQLTAIVERSIGEVGPSYGYRMMKGHIDQQFTKSMGISAKRIQDCMKYVDPGNAAARLIGAHKRFNPKAYFAPYFGYNLHIDQNEKCVDYGVVYVTANDGYSSYVFDYAVMGKKNNLVIYRDMFVPIIRDYGLFINVLADHGTEFNLVLFMQQYFWSIVDPQRPCSDTYQQMKSTKNNRIERWWSENNQRLGYSMKTAFVQLESMGLASPRYPHHLYATSQIGMWVSRYGCAVTKNAWNNHHVRRRGIPVKLARNSGAIGLDPAVICDVDDAHRKYRLAGGGNLTEDSVAGIDLLVNDRYRRQLRDDIFANVLAPQIGDVAYVFGRLVNNDYRPFQTMILTHIHLSESMM